MLGIAVNFIITALLPMRKGFQACELTEAKHLWQPDALRLNTFHNWFDTSCIWFDTFCNWFETFHNLYESPQRMA
jgi:hypothetical protein